MNYITWQQPYIFSEDDKKHSESQGQTNNRIIIMENFANFANKISSTDI